MAEPVSGIAAVASATNIIARIIQHSFTSSEVPHDVQSFQSSIESFSATLSKARRLRRVTSHLLDSKDKQEIDMNIKRAVNIFDDISGTIEACRKDLDNKGTVSARNRILWMVRDHDVFLARTHSFGMCHQNLISDISGMRQLQSTTQLQPPAYSFSEFEGSLCPPSRRLPRPESKQLGLNAYESTDNPDWKSPSLRPLTFSDSDKIVVDEDIARDIAPTGLTHWTSRSSLTLTSSHSDCETSISSGNRSTSTPRRAPWRTRKSFGSVSSYPSESDTSSIVVDDAMLTPPSDPAVWRRDSSQSFEPYSAPDYSIGVTSGDYGAAIPSTALWETRSSSDLTYNFQSHHKSTVDEDISVPTSSATPRRQRRGYMIT